MLLDDLYETVTTRPSDIVGHLDYFAELVVEMDARKVIDLGVRSGVATVVFLYALQKTGGELWSVDLDMRPPIGEYPHWHFIQGDDTSREVYAAMPTDVDIVLIDTSHTYTHTRRELSMYRWLCRKGAVMLLHDTEVMYPALDEAPFPVKRAISDFCVHEDLLWENREHCNGLGIVHL